MENNTKCNLNISFDLTDDFKNINLVDKYEEIEHESHVNLNISFDLEGKELSSTEKEIF